MGMRRREDTRVMQEAWSIWDTWRALLPQARKASHMTQRELAAAIGTSQGRVGMVESPAAAPGRDSVLMPRFLPWVATIGLQFQADNREGRTVIRLRRWEPYILRKLAAIRQLRQLSQREVARLLSVHQSTVTDLEARAAGARVPIFIGYLIALGYAPALRPPETPGLQGEPGTEGEQK